MNTTDRLKELNNLFLRKQFQVNYAHVKSYFDITSYSERSFSRDMNFLKQALAERYPTLTDAHGELIKFARSTGFFTYVRDDISAFPNFSDRELNQIASTIDFNKHLFTDGAGAGLVNKLRAIALENQLAQQNTPLAWSAIQLIKDGERSGAENMKDILASIYSQQLIEFSHKGLSAHATKKTIQGLPFLIKEYNNGWYTGWYVLLHEVIDATQIIKPTLSSLRLYALDRLDSLRILQTPLKTRIHPEFNPADYFAHSLGIFRDKESGIEEVIFEFKKTSWMINYINKYPIHRSQKTHLETDEVLQIALNIEIDQELVNYFMRYAQDLCVIEPIHLRNKIIDGIQIVMDNYSLDFKT